LDLDLILLTFACCICYFSDIQLVADMERSCMITLLLFFGTRKLS